MTKRNDWLLSRARSSIEQSTNLSITLTKQITPVDLEYVTQELEAAQLARADKLATFIRYITDGLNVEQPPDATLRVYMQQLELFESVLPELAARILKDWKYKSFPSIQFIQSAHHSLPASRRLFRLHMLKTKLENILSDES